MDAFPYIPGTPPKSSEPFTRYLPLIPDGIAQEWLELNFSQESESQWVVDPFGASPRLAVEIAKSGRRIIVAANNPIMRFLLEMAAVPPAESEFRAALAELASSFRGKERLEPQIRSLYRIPCSNCGSEVEVDAFLWEKGANFPFGSLYTCDICDSTGEHLISRMDAEKVNVFSTSSLHRARALERVVATDDPDRTHVEEALEVYLPRSLYILFTLINRIDGLQLSPSRRRALQALLLFACDAATTLWGYPSERERPRQLITPPRFREKNIWNAMEEAIQLWSSKSVEVPLTIWPAMPPESGGICLYEGPFRDLASRLKSEAGVYKMGCVISALPRPNQAFWTLSALWSGWLWGREAVGPFKSVLRRRRYDWSWHFTALHSAYESLMSMLANETPMLGLTGELETGLLTAVLCAAGSVGFKVQNIAIRGEQAQIHWMKQPTGQFQTEKDGIHASTQAIRDFLCNYGQPAPFLPTWSAGLMGYTNVESFENSVEDGGNIPGHVFGEAQSSIKDTLSYRGGFLRYGGGESFENSLWWFRDELKAEQKAPEHPLSDRLEMHIVNQLVKNRHCNFHELDELILKSFPGLLTPDEEWLPVILDSYALETSPGSGAWSLRPEDQPKNRRTDLDMMGKQLAILAEKVGFTQEGDFPLVWVDSRNQKSYWFYPTVSAVFTNIILGKLTKDISPAEKSIIVLPGGRANLAAYKLQRDPRLKRLCQPLDSEANFENEISSTGWRFLKFRHLLWLVDNATQMPQPIENLFKLDPLTFSAPQMRLL